MDAADPSEIAVLICEITQSPTDCGVSQLCDHETSTKRGGPGPYRAVEPYKKKIYIM
jgi:hypothetical protein